MALYRLRPPQVEARQLVNDADSQTSIYQWVEKHTQSFDPLEDPPKNGISIDPATGGILLATENGVVAVDDGDWIIQGTDGMFFKLDNDTFRRTFESV